MNGGVQGKRNYYTTFTLEQYLEELSGLKYFEIQNDDGRFITLLRVSVLKQDGNVDRILTDEFISTLEHSQILQRYSGSLITQHVGEDTGIVASLKLMRKKHISEMAVLGKDGKFVGLLQSKTLQKRIVDNVLMAKDNA